MLFSPSFSFILYPQKPQLLNNSELEPYVKYGFCNHAVWGDFVENWVLAGWDDFRNRLPEAEAAKARLILTFDHAPGHVRWLGGRRSSPRLIRPDVGVVLVGREVTK